MIALMRGIWTPVRTTWIPVSARIVSNNAAYLLSRSRMRNRAWQPRSYRSMTRLRTAWVTQAAVRVRGGAEDADPAGRVLDDRQDVRPGAGQSHGFEEVCGEDRLGLGAQERRPALGATVRCRVDAGVLEDFPDGGRGDLDAQDEEFAVDAALPPRSVLPRQA
jgi:hypothetical protein